ncbi:hypothetical protein MXB_1199 [Myxobolus squamalis]|nr:hypothetical protein MXB_1199 [Myxobolus squamalis]
MKLSHRRDALLVNGNDDNGLMYGNWGEIKDGTSPGLWRDLKNIYVQYLNEALSASGCRNMGIACRTVSIFNSGHDNEKDGILKIYLDEKTLKTLNNSETLW